MFETLALLDIAKLNAERELKEADVLRLFQLGASPILREAANLRTVYDRGDPVNLKPLFSAMDEFMLTASKIKTIRQDLLSSDYPSRIKTLLEALETD